MSAVLIAGPTASGKSALALALAERFGGTVIAMDTFGASAPLKELQTKFGFTPEAVVSAARALVGR